MTHSTKLIHTCEYYSKIHVPCNYWKTLKKPSVCIMKKEKGRGVVVMKRSKYTGKF